MGLGQNFWLGLGRVNFLLGLGRIGSAIFGLGLGLENFSKKLQILYFWVKKIDSGWVKEGSASYLLRVKSMLGSGQGTSRKPGWKPYLLDNESILFW